MAPFELDLTKTKILDIDVLSQKNRDPADNPGLKVSVEQTLSNDTLVYFDGRLLAATYEKSGPAAAPAQGALEGVPAVSDKPNLTSLGKHLGWIKGDWEFTGSTVTIDQGLGGRKSNLTLADCTLSGFRLKLKEGGSYVAKYNIESPDASEAMFGKFAKLKGREVEAKVDAPSIDQQQRNLDDGDDGDTDEPTGHEAGDAFAGAHAAAH